MATTTATMIYIGRLATTDVNESDFNSGSANVIRGTYNHTAMQTVNVIGVDQGNDGIVNDDETGLGDFAAYSLAGQSQQSQWVDSTMVFRSTVVLTSGLSRTIDVVVVQMVNGDTFVSDLENRGTLDNLSIRSLTLTQALGTNYSGYFSNQSTSNTQAVCFCAGTMIATQSGPVAVEKITQGMMVWTLDHGYQRCLGSVSRKHLDPGSKQSPVIIGAGALGPDTPATPLRVSPQHRVLISSPVAQRMYGRTEVLTPAKELAQISGVEKTLGFLPVHYVHLIFENHEIVCANGMWAETLLSGPQACLVLEDDPRLPRRMDPARPLAHGRRVRHLLERHMRNCTPKGKPLSPAPVLPLHAGVGALTGKDALEPAGLVQ